MIIIVAGLGCWALILYLLFAGDIGHFLVPGIVALAVLVLVVYALSRVWK